MKLYANTENENGKKEGMGGNEKLTIGLNKGNKNVATIDFTDTHIKIWYEGNKYWCTELEQKGKDLKGENCDFCRDEKCPRRNGKGWCQDIPS